MRPIQIEAAQAKTSKEAFAHSSFSSWFYAEFHPDVFSTITTLQFLNPTVPLFAILCYILFFGNKTPRIREWKTFSKHVFELFKTNQRTIVSSQFQLAASLIHFHICKEIRLDYVEVLSQMFCTILFLYLQLTRNIVGEMKIFGHFYFPT